jgi:HEAT repeat protein
VNLDTSPIKATASESWKERLSEFRASQPNHQQLALDFIIKLLKDKNKYLTQSELFSLAGGRLKVSQAKQLLALCVNNNILTNRTKKPRGYGLPEWPLD